MGILKNFLSRIFLRYRKYKLKRHKNVRFGAGSYFSRNSGFGGNNFLSTNAELINSEIGFASYLGIETQISNAKIGKYTSIGPYVKCIFGNHPTNTFVSTHPAFFSLRKQSGFTFVKEQLFDEFSEPIVPESHYSIQIGNDVWIGARVTILDGVTIGDGAIIASGALVNRNVPPYAIYGGVPAKEIKKRFGQSEIETLLEFKWWNKDFNWLQEKSEIFSDIEKFKQALLNDE